MENKYESLMNRKWRPAIAWLYFVVCLFDFLVFPIGFAILQDRAGDVTLSWSPLTIQGGGLFHIAMGAIIGVTAWSRGQEKMTYMGYNVSSNQPYTDVYTDSPNRYDRHPRHDNRRISRRVPEEGHFPEI